MAGCEVLAFLFCERASSSSDGKASLHGIFDEIVLSSPRRPLVSYLGAREPTDFFVFYKAVVDQPCILSLKVFYPSGRELPNPLWIDPINQGGLVQSVWVMATAFFVQSGAYKFELWHNFSARLVTAYLDVIHAAA